MGDKSGQKKGYILETARKVFSEKGFCGVTMQDIVAACAISRGGLYLYFSSTEEIFKEVLKQEQAEEDDTFSDSIPEDATASDVLAFFLKEQKREIMRRKHSLTVAIYEYYFHCKVPKRDNVIKKQFDAGVLILENLIREGIQANEFYCEDPEGAAGNIMYMLEGLKVTARTVGLSEAAIDKELLYVVQGLVFD